MNESQSQHQQLQKPFREEHNRSSENFNGNRKSGKKRTRAEKRIRRENRQRRRDEQQKKWHDQDKWGGSKRVYGRQQRRDRGRRNNQNDNYYAEQRDRYNWTREMGAQQSIDNYPQNSVNYQENRGRQFEVDETRGRAANDAVVQSPLPQRERSNTDVPRKICFNEQCEPINENVIPPNVDKIVEKVTLNIKTEKKDDEPKKDETSSSSSSDSDESSKDSAIKRLHTVVNSVLSKNPPKKSHQPKINIKEEKRSSSSGTSSDSSSDSDSHTQKATPAKPPPAKKNSSEEEVICLGKMERKEDLVDDEDEDMPLPMEDEKVCFLCDKPGHVALECFTVCKNCNGQYHGLKNCPKPPNISLVLQFFMQFCMDQLCKYNPSNKFNLDGYQQFNPQQLFSNHEESIERLRNNSSNRKRRNSNDAGSSVSKASRRRREDSSTEESESSSDENIKRKDKRRSKSISDFDVPQQMPFTPAAYSAALPFAFNPSAMGMNPAMNPLLAFGQMMGYNNPPPKRTSKSKKK